MYTNNGNRKSVNNVMSPVTDSICFSCGGEYKLNEKLTLAGGALYSLYFEDSYEFMGSEIELNKVVVSGCISATYRFF